MTAEELLDVAVVDSPLAGRALHLFLLARAEPNGGPELMAGAQGLALLALGLKDEDMHDLELQAEHYDEWADATAEMTPFDVWFARRHRA